MEIKWTEEQNNAIRIRGRRLLVSAAAGSGKTAVLSERIIRRVLDEKEPVSVDELLVMTFTRAAASEMKERIRAGLVKLLEDKDKMLSAAQSLRLRNQIAIMDSAMITTIDSFCMSILRDYTDMIDIDPSFRVAEEAELVLLKEEVFEEMFEEKFSSADRDFIDFVESYTTGNAGEGLEDIIESVYEFAQSTPWPDEWYQKQLDDLEKEKAGEAGYLEYLRTRLYTLLEAVKKGLNILIEICSQEEGPEQYISAINSDIDQIDAILDAKDAMSMLTELKKYKPERLSSKRNVADAALKEAVKAARTRYKEFLTEKLRKNFIIPELSEEEREDVRRYISILIKLTREFDQRFSEKKRERNVIDFNDEEHIALRILNEHEDIADVYRERFDEIYIDEFQDSNMVQETLVRLIEKGNVFMVGDVKQSIYGFRQADPDIFNDKFNTFASFEEASENADTRIILSANYRSREKILAAINSVFKTLMTESLGGIEYTDEVKLNPGGNMPPLPESSEHMLPSEPELIMLDMSDADEGDDKRSAEARLVAERIKMLTDPDSGMLIWDKNTGDYRIAGYKDIAVLLRSTKDQGSLFQNVLNDAGIPAHAENKKGYFDSLEVRTMLAVLEAIENRHRDIPMLAYIHSPIIGMSSEEIAVMTAEYKETIGKDAYFCVFDALTASDNIKAKTAVKKLDDYFTKASYMSLTELLLYIFEDSGYYIYVTALPSGQIRKANLDMLVNMAGNYEKTGYKGIFSFVRYANNLKEYDTDFGEASVTGEHDDAVRIMSIHSSKGLEFPIVFVSALDKAFNNNDSKSRILIDKQLGVGLEYTDLDNRIKKDTLKKQIVEYKKKDDQLGEELRILYVAMTRAKEQLYLTGIVKNAEKRMEKNDTELIFGESLLSEIRSRTNFLDWLLLAADSHIKITAVKAEELIGSAIGEAVREEEIRSELLAHKLSEDNRAKLDEIFDYSYPDITDVGLRNKISISELKRIGQDIDEQTAETPSRDKKKIAGEISGSDRGTIYHAFMEKLDYDADIDYSSLNPVINPGDIRKWTASDLGRRFAKAQAEGRLKREFQFIMGMPADELGIADSKELILIQGIIDAFIPDGDGICLIDYKTDRVSSGDELVRKYSKQLYYYSVALEKMYHRPVKEKYIWSFTLGEAVRV